jgi:hypothetical protein
MHNPDSKIKTPNTDALASGAVVFDSAYCPSQLCATFRLPIITGQPPTKIGFYDNAVSTGPLFFQDHADNMQCTIDSGVPTYAQYLLRGSLIVEFCRLYSKASLEAPILGQLPHCFWHLHPPLLNLSFPPTVIKELGYSDNAAQLITATGAVQVDGLLCNKNIFPSGWKGNPQRAPCSQGRCRSFLKRGKAEEDATMKSMLKCKWSKSKLKAKLEMLKSTPSV